ncbi:MAG: hypothetical protein ACFFD1_16385 [Candidatus Thorarchaeota archaeon]
MKKITFLIIIQFIFLCCSDNSTNTISDSLIGKWQRIKETTISSLGTNIRNSDTVGWDNIIMTFYNDGTFVQGGDVNRSGTYEVTGNELVLANPNNDYSETVTFEIDNDILRISGSYFDDDLGENIQVISEWQKI